MAKYKKGLITKQTLSEVQFNWKMYQKKHLTCAARIRGAFTVETLEGTLSCNDGYLAIDIKGNPYPIEKKIFKKTYKLLSSRICPRKEQRNER